MKICETEGCSEEFEPNTANQKYADASCRKSIDTMGLCKYRKENGKGILVLKHRNWGEYLTQTRSGWLEQA